MTSRCLAGMVLPLMRIEGLIPVVLFVCVLEPSGEGLL